MSNIQGPKFKIDDNSDNEDEKSLSSSKFEAIAEDTAVAQGRYSIFTKWEKRALVLAASLMAFISPLSAQIYLPVLPTLAREFSVTNDKINLTITTYMIFQGITPMFIGSLADSCGRRPAYVICFVVYIAANIGLALSQSYASLLVVRCLQSAGSSSTAVLNSAVLADVITSAERGEYVGYTLITLGLAPTVGPLLGGVLVQRLGWRAIFWFLTTLGGSALLLLLIFFPETNRQIVRDGSRRPPTAYLSGYQFLRRRHAARSPMTEESANEGHQFPRVRKFNPLASFTVLSEKENFLVLIYGSIVFACFYAVAAALPSQFATLYGYDETTIGLLYVPVAGGSISAAFLVGPLMNWNYRRHCNMAGVVVEKDKQQDLSQVSIEKARLEVGIPLVFITAFALAGWGWALENRAHVAVACVLMFVLGVAMIGFINTSNALLIDLNKDRAGAATAAGNVTRCLVGAAASYAILPMTTAIGNGWSYTMVAALLILCLPALLATMRWGRGWREQDKLKTQKEEQQRSTLV